MAEVWDRGMEGMRKRDEVKEKTTVCISIYLWVCVHALVSTPTESDQTPLSLLCAAVSH